MRRFIMLLIALLFLTGCIGEILPGPAGQQSDPTGAAAGQTIDPEWAWLLEEPTGPEATEAALELTKESLAAHLAFYFQLNSSSEAAYMDAIAAARSFTVTSYAQNGDTVTASVTVSVPDVYAIITGMELSAYATAEETDAALSSAIKSAVPREKQVTITFAAGSNRWIPTLDEAAADACYGGLLTYLQEETEGAE